MTAAASAPESLLPDWTPLPKDHFSTMTLTGDTLRTILDRPAPQSPLPGFLDPRPSLHLLVAEPKVGKTTLCATLAVAAAAGIAPWPGARPLPQGRVLFVTAEESAAQTAATMERLAKRLGLSREQWTDRLGLLAADDLLKSAGETALTLNGAGLDQLTRALDSSRKLGDPVRFVFLDSASSLSASAGLDENDNSAVTAWLRPLQALAVRFGVYVFVIHHEGHSKRAGTVSRARGASAFGAVARVIWSLDRPKNAPHERRLRVAGNAVPEAEHRFTVTEAASHALVESFEPVLSDTEKLDRVTAIGEEVSVAEAAARILRFDGKPVPDRPRDIGGALKDRTKAAFERGVALGFAERCPDGGGYRRLASLVADPLADLAPAASSDF
jgi:hypothetical protein